VKGHSENKTDACETGGGTKGKTTRASVLVF
jgi:hypothetical protein